MTNTNYTDGQAFLAKISAQAESLLHSLEQAAGGISLSVNTNKVEYMCFKQKEAISTFMRQACKISR